MKLKLTNAEVTELIHEYVDILNDRFTDYHFTLKYYAYSMKAKQPVVALQCFTDPGLKIVIPARPKKQLLEAIKLFDLGSYMHKESTNPIINN